jgi:hypothetical protein
MYTNRRNENPRYRHLLRAALSFETGPIMNTTTFPVCIHPSCPFHRPILSGLGGLSPLSLLVNASRFHLIGARDHDRNDPIAWIHVMAYPNSLFIGLQTYLFRMCTDLFLFSSIKSSLQLLSPILISLMRPRLLFKPRPLLFLLPPTLV